MFLTSWLGHKKFNRQRRHRTRLLFEQLEDRTVPNTYMPTIFDDSRHVWSAEWGGPSFETVAEAKAWAEQAYRRPILWQDCT